MSGSFVWVYDLYLFRLFHIMIILHICGVIIG